MAARRPLLALALLLASVLPPPAGAAGRAGPTRGTARGPVPGARTLEPSVPDTGSEPPNSAPTLADFVAALEPLGSWKEHSRHGQVWRPARPGPDWAPYLRGRWAHTPAGWYWVGDEPWAWATYHYGRWFLDAAEGWTWVPGRRWAPAWVAWREGKGLVGWAPLQPDGAAHPATYLFVEARRMGDPVEQAVLPPARGGEALRSTRAIGAPARRTARAP